MPNKCPDCDKYIRPDAFRCSCGWTKLSHALANLRPFIDCAYHGCQTSATVRVRKPTGWANLCVEHYGNDNLEESREYCRKHGLDTTEKKIAHIKALLAKPKDPRAWMRNPKSAIARRYAAEVRARERPMREPGQDDEEREVA